MRLLLCFVFVTGAVGCLSAAEGRKTMNQLLRRAAFDLRCPEIEIEAQSLGPRTVGVRGCGAQASYLLICNERMIPRRCSWVMNGAITRDSDRDPAAESAPEPPEHRKAEGRPIPIRPKTTPPRKKRRPSRPGS